MAHGKSRLSRILIVLGVLALLTAIFWSVGLGLGTSRLARSQAALDNLIGTPAELTKRFPEGSANASAQELERLMDGLGHSITPKHRQAPGAPRLENALRQQVGRWLTSRIEGTEPAPLPTEIVEFLATNAETLDEIETLLLEGDLPRWERGTFGDMEAPIPNLLGHVTLSRLLQVRALVSAGRGNGEAADRDLQAAWRLADSLQGHGALIAGLIEIAERRMVLGTLRQVRTNPSAWDTRLQSMPLLDDPAAIFLGEAQMPRWLSEASRSQLASGLGVGGSGFVRELGLVAAKPLIRASAAEGNELWALILEEMRRAGHCELALGEGLTGLEPLEQHLSRWNVPMKVAFPNLLNAGRRLARLALEVDATRQVLAAEMAARDGQAGTAEVTGSCPEWTWRRDITPSGSVLVEWSGPEPWSSSSSSTAYPLSAEFELSR